MRRSDWFLWRGGLQYRPRFILLRMGFGVVPFPPHSCLLLWAKLKWLPALESQRKPPGHRRQSCGELLHPSFWSWWPGRPQPSPEVGQLCEGADPARLLSWLSSNSCERTCKPFCDQKLIMSKNQPVVAQHRTLVAKDIPG